MRQLFKVWVTLKFGKIERDNMSVGSFLKSCERVLKVATKPSKEEFLKTSKITALGIFLIGGIGFVIFLIFTLGGIYLI